MTSLGSAIGRRPVEGKTADASSDPVPVDDVYERAFVYGALVCSAIALLVFVWQYGRDIPFWDEWEFVPVLSGEQSATPSWFWASHNEHRFALTRLAMLAVWRLDLGHLTLSFVAAGLLIGTALVLVETARRLRGRATYTDAALAVLVVQWGHFENLIFGLQIIFIASVAFACIAVSVIALDGWRGRLGQVIALALVLVLLPVNGAMGVIFVMPLAAWAAFAAFVRRREGDDDAPRDALILGAAAAAAVALVVANLVSFERNAAHPVARSLGAVVSTTLEVFSIAVGPTGRLLWPYLGIAVIGAALLAGLYCIAVVWVQPRERSRALGLLAGLAAFGGVGLAIGYARAGFGPDQGFSDRYMILVAPLVAMTYLVAIRYIPTRRGAFLSACLATAVALLLVPGYGVGKQYGIHRATTADALAADAKRGLPTEVIAQRHFTYFYPDEALFAQRLDMLRRHRLSIFADAPAAAAACERRSTIDLELVASNDVTWSAPDATATGGDPYVVFDIGEPRHVCAVDVTYVIDRGSPGPGALTAYWMRSGVNDFAPTERMETVSVVADGTEHTTTFWVDGVIDRFRLDPDSAPTRMTVRRLVAREP